MYSNEFLKEQFPDFESLSPLSEALDRATTLKIIIIAIITVETTMMHVFFLVVFPNS